MTYSRFPAAFLTFASILAIAPLLTRPLAAQSRPSDQKTWRAARMPDGHPDLQGVWTNSTLTPLERPAQLADKSALSEAEAAAYEKRVLDQTNRDRRDGGADADVGRAYNELFFEHGKGLAHIGGTIRTSMIIDPPDGHVPPLTPEAQKRNQAINAENRAHPADGPENRSLTERCLFWNTTGPPMLPGPYNNAYQIYQSPGYIVILSEMIHEPRIIPMDGRPHLASNIRKWAGDSIGHWEGETLVVDTTNFTDKTRFRGSGENLHVIERFTRTAPDTIVYRFTIDDPTTFTKSWTGELPFTASTTPIYEYACHEGNYALVDILSGARAEEKKAAK